jgi:hypothetical protein
MVYDTTLGSVLMFGGRFGNQHKNDLWQYDGTLWKSFGDAPVTPRSAHALAYDTHRGVLVLFGGEDWNAYQPGTWEWDSTLTNWTERVVMTKPENRSEHAMTYDAQRQRTVLFGGYRNGALGDTWEYRVLGGTCTTTAECDGVPCVDGACCETSLCGTCSACSVASGACEPVLGMEDPDSCTGDQTCDAQADCKSKSGQACTAPGDCASGFCADGVCCNAPCQGACEACDQAGAVGACTLVSGQARHGSCPGAPPCGATCTGNSPSCEFASSGAPCGESCQDATFVASECDGQGVCVEQGPLPCPNGFACDGSSCHFSCSVDEQCAAPRVCRQGACLPPSAICKDSATLEREDGSTEDCAPYTCASGACLDSCTFAAQCAPGFVCDAERHCVSVNSAGSDDDEGCGCRAVGKGSDRGGGAVLLGLCLLLPVLRRQRATAGLRPAHRPG